MNKFVEIVTNNVCPNMYGDSPGWIGVIEANDPGKGNPTNVLIETVFGAISTGSLGLVTSLHANSVFLDWVEQRSISKSKFNFLKVFENAGWIKIEDLYGGNRTFNQVIDDLGRSEGKEAFQDEQTDKFNMYWESRVADLPLLKLFWTWCIDINYFSGDVFLVSENSGIIFYPYYLENGLGIISFEPKGEAVANDIVRKVMSIGEYKFTSNRSF